MATAYSEGRRNYAGEVVAIPAGATVAGANFAQLVPGSDAIVCDGPLRLVECNLVNVRIDPRWTLERCNTAQVWYVVTTLAPPSFDAAEVERLRVLGEVLTAEEWAKIEADVIAPPETTTAVHFVCAHPDALPADLTPPPGARTEA